VVYVKREDYKEDKKIGQTLAIRYCWCSAEKSLDVAKSEMPRQEPAIRSQHGARAEAATAGMANKKRSWQLIRRADCQHAEHGERYDCKDHAAAASRLPAARRVVRKECGGSGIREHGRKGGCKDCGGSNAHM
jgi:hypothetical protein